MRARERETREREARERIARERQQKEKEQREKDAREREAREAEARIRIEKEIREKLETEQRIKAEEAARKKAELEKAEAEARAVKAEAEAKAAKEKADRERAERLKAARERAERDREARQKAAEIEKAKLAAAEKAKVAAAAAATSSTVSATPSSTPSTTPSATPSITARRSATYGMGVGEKLDLYNRGSATPSVTSTHSTPQKSTVTATSSPSKRYEKPTAKSYVGTQDGDATSYRPYDQPKRASKAPSQSSVYSESSYAPSQSTARTTPPPSVRGPYSTADPDKIVIKAVYLFNDLFPKPVAQLVSGIGNVTDGLILRITTEGLFIDDDVRGVPQREWDIKAWTMKFVETGERNGKNLLRASIRDPDGKKYVFIIGDEDNWKVAVGLQRLRRGTQVRALGVNGMPAPEVRNLLTSLGWA